MCSRIWSSNTPWQTTHPHPHPVYRADRPGWLWDLPRSLSGSSNPGYPAPESTLPTQPEAGSSVGTPSHRVTRRSQGQAWTQWECAVNDHSCLPRAGHHQHLQPVCIQNRQRGARRPPGPKAFWADIYLERPSTALMNPDQLTREAASARGLCAIRGASGSAPPGPPSGPSEGVHANEHELSLCPSDLSNARSLPNTLALTPPPAATPPFWAPDPWLPGRAPSFRLPLGATPGLHPHPDEDTSDLGATRIGQPELSPCSCDSRG